MSEAGRPTELDNELCLKIRDLVLEGKVLREIAEEVGIAYKTIEGWKTRNYEGFADKLMLYKQEWRMLKVEENMDEILVLQPESVVVNGLGEVARNPDGTAIRKLDSNLLKIKAGMTQFVAETLGKKTYSKRSELTGADGKDLSTGLNEEQKKKLDELIIGKPHDQPTSSGQSN